MSKLRLLKGFLENTSVQNLIIKRGLKLAIAGFLITSMSVNFIGCKSNKENANNEAKSSVEETIENDKKDEDKNEKKDSKSKKDEEKKDTTKEKKSDLETDKKNQNNTIHSTQVQSNNKEYITSNNTTVKPGNVVAINTTPRVNTSASTTTNKESKVETTKVEEPKSEDPNVQNPTTEDPKVENPKTEDPKVQDPITEDPKVEDPKTYNEDTMPKDYLNISKEKIRKALSDKGFKYNEKLNNRKYTKSIIVPMYQSNDLKENEINELTNILTKSKSTEFNLTLNRNSVQAKDHMRITLYFNPDLTDANNDGYEDNLMLTNYTKDELNALENTYKNLLNINGYKLVDYVDGSNKIGEVTFPMHHNNAKKETELSKILNLLDTLKSENISMKIQANTNATITLNFYDTIKKDVPTPDGNEDKVVTPVVVSTSNTAPVIECVEELSIKQGNKFDVSKLNLKVTDKEDGDNVKFTIDDSALNTSKPGPYSIIVKATDSNGLQTTKVVLVVVTTEDVEVTTPVVTKTDEKKTSNSIVKVFNNSAPVINCVDEISINQGEKFDVSKLDLKVTDKEDGDNVKFTIDDSAINTSKLGPQPIIIKATDSKGLQATKVVLVVVKANTQA